MSGGYSLPGLSYKLENYINANKKSIDDVHKIERKEFINKTLESGGKFFLEAIHKYGRNEKGEHIDLDSSYSEYLELIGDFRIKQTYTTGCAQVGKTLGHYLLMLYCISIGRLNTGWFYDTKTSLDQNVPIMFLPLARNWLKSMEETGIKFNRKYDRNINTRFQLEQVTGVFGYVSTGRIIGSGQAAAGSAVVAYQIDLAFLEERSQYHPGEGDPVKRRLDASSMPTKPIRELGTPGGGQGIEGEMLAADRYFYPHFRCKTCDEWYPIDPKGCLLQKVKRHDTVTGKDIETYFSESGRPLKWFCENENDPIKTAYIGCPGCGKELDDDERINSIYKCIKTGQTARDFIDNLPKGIPKVDHKVSIHLSPLTRKKPNRIIATEIISEGLTVIRTDDWQQQMLGWASENTLCHLTTEMLIASINSPRPDKEADFILAGIDIGRSEDWIIITEFYLPENYYNLSIAEVIEKTIRVVRYGGGINRSEIIEKLEDNYVEYGIVDNEPSMESSINLCRESVLEMGNQIAGQRQPVKATTVSDGGIDYPCWYVRNEKFMNSVMEGFILNADDGYPLYRLPKEWDKWIGNPTQRSPLVHLTGPWRDAENKWHRGKDNIDDLYMACLFCEVAFYLKLSMDIAPLPEIGSYRP